MFKPLAFLLALVAATATAASVTMAGSASPARALDNNQTFTDSTGEGAGIDVQSLSMSNDNLSNITLVINAPNRPTLTPDMLFLVFVDADSNPATGDPQSLGADYAIQLEGPLGGQQAGVGLFRWDGTDFTSAGVAQSSLTFGYANGAATIKINAADLGATKKFNFYVIAVSEVALDANGDADFSKANVDFVPDAGHGLFAYQVKTLPPALVVKTFGMKPAKAHAGSKLSVFLTYVRSDGTASTGVDTPTCKASVAGHAVKSTAVLVGSRATCTVTIPKTAKGKTVRIVLTVVGAEGTKATHTFSAKVS